MSTTPPPETTVESLTQETEGEETARWAAWERFSEAMNRVAESSEEEPAGDAKGCS